MIGYKTAVDKTIWMFAAFLGKDPLAGEIYVNLKASKLFGCFSVRKRTFL